MNIETIYQKFGEQELINKIEVAKFTPYFLHLIP